MGNVAEDWLGKWAVNQMLINVATRKFARSVRLPDGEVPAPSGAGLTKSAVSRRFVALSAGRMKEWMASDLSCPASRTRLVRGRRLDPRRHR
jgi:hypothetical protein